MLKISGFLIITLCGAYAGFLKSNQLKKRVDIFDKYIMFITHIKISVSYSSDIIKEILIKTDIPYFRDYALAIAEKMNEGKPFFESWCNAIEILNRENILSESDINMIKDFGRGLGTSDISGQISCCELANTKAYAALEICREEYKNKSGLYRILGASAGIGIGLLFI